MKTRIKIVCRFGGQYEETHEDLNDHIDINKLVEAARVRASMIPPTINCETVVERYEEAEDSG